MKFTDPRIARVVQAQVAADLWKRKHIQRGLTSRQLAIAYRKRLIAAGILKTTKGIA